MKLSYIAGGCTHLHVKHHFDVDVISIQLSGCSLQGDAVSLAALLSTFMAGESASMLCIPMTLFLCVHVCLCVASGCMGLGAYSVIPRSQAVY